MVFASGKVPGSKIYIFVYLDREDDNRFLYFFRRDSVAEIQVVIKSSGYLLDSVSVPFESRIFKSKEHPSGANKSK